MVMGDYHPVYEIRDGVKWLVKHETKDYLFKTTNSLSIQAEALKEADMVEVRLPDGRILVASFDEIFEYHDIMQFYGETKFYYPIDRWHEIRR